MPGERRLSIVARVPALRAERPRLDVALDLAGGITVVMGPSGSGKTTLLTTIAGLIRPEAGRIVLDDDVLFDAATGTHMPPHRRRVALVFQSLALFPHLSTWKNVAYPIRDQPAKIRRERALSWLARTRVAHLADRAPSTLSGGEAQRVALARALASEPRALLLDEPFSALDSHLRDVLGAELVALAHELGVPVLLVTHDPRGADALNARVFHLEAGRLCESAP